MKNSVVIAGAMVALGLSASSALACNPFVRSPTTQVQPGGSVGPPATAPALSVMPPDAFAPDSNGSGRNKSIVGMWHVIHKDRSGDPILETLEQWHADGTEIEYANIPPGYGPTCFGVWTQNGPDYQLYHTTFFWDLDGHFQGTMQFRATYHVERGNNAFSGPFDEKDYDPQGNLMKETRGTVEGQRLVSSQ